MGRGDRTFRILKFRTMIVDADARKGEVAHLNKHAGGDERMFKAPNDPRVTRVGRFLRRYSLDELPQLVERLAGRDEPRRPAPADPRGAPPCRRVGAQDGSTSSPASRACGRCSARDDIPFGEMVELDYRYVTTWSLFEDLRLMLRTVPVVLRGAGGSL